MAGYIEPDRRRRSRWQRFKDYWVELWELQFPDKNVPNFKRKKKKRTIGNRLKGLVDDAFTTSELEEINIRRKIKKSWSQRLKIMLEDSIGKTELNLDKPRQKFSFRKWLIRQIEFFSEKNELDVRYKANAVPFKVRAGEFFESIKTLRFRIDLWKFDLIPFINSSMMVVSVYLFVFALHEFATGVVATHYFLKPIIFLYRIKYLNYYDAGIWNLWSVTRSYSAGPLFCFFSGIVVFFIYQVLPRINRHIRLFLLWYSCLALILFYSKVIFIPITSVSGLGTWEGLGIVAAWFYIGTFQKIMLAFLAAGSLFLTGFIFTKPFMKMAATHISISTPDDRGRLINQLAVGPLLFATIIIFSLNQEYNIVPNAFTLSSGLFMLIVSYFNSHANEGVEIHKSEKKETFSFILLGLMSITIAGFIYIMQQGIHLDFHFM